MSIKDDIRSKYKLLRKQAEQVYDDSLREIAYDESRELATTDYVVWRHVEVCNNDLTNNHVNSGTYPFCLVDSGWKIIGFVAQGSESNYVAIFIDPADNKSSVIEKGSMRACITTLEIKASLIGYRLDKIND